MHLSRSGLLALSVSSFLSLSLAAGLDFYFRICLEISCQFLGLFCFVFLVLCVRFHYTDVFLSSAFFVYNCMRPFSPFLVLILFLMSLFSQLFFNFLHTFLFSLSLSQISSFFYCHQDSSKYSAATFQYIYHVMPGCACSLCCPQGVLP